MALSGLGFVRHDGLSLALVQASQVLQVLGKGGLGQVHLRQLGDQQLVVKTVQLKDARTVKRASVEAHVAKQLNHHPGLPQYLACFADEAAQEVHLVMQPFIGCCNLLQVLRDIGPLPEPRAAQVTKQLVSVLQHLHQEQLVYVDLKAENVLLREVAGVYEVQLVDFDCCVSCPTAGSAVNARALPPHLHLGLDSADSIQDSSEQPHFWGTLEYAAPEVIQQGHKAYSPASDWWSLGVLVFEMLYGCTPFKGPCQERVIYSITMRSPVFPDQPQVTASATSFIRSLLRHKVEYRLGVQEQPQRHAWLTASAHP